jgi:hypothetical protein
MKKIIGISLSLVLLACSISYGAKTVKGKARVDATTKKVTCHGSDADCYRINNGGTVEVNVEGDWYEGTWSLPSLTSNPGGTPLTYLDLPEVIDPSTINIDVECPTCPPTDPEE